MSNSQTRQGVKLLINGLESSGKSTVGSKIKDALVIVIDEKPYSFAVPHYKPTEYTGLVAFGKELGDKINAYIAKYDGPPRTVVVDTVTKFYSNVTKYANDTERGFDIHNRINLDTMGFNTLIEKMLIQRGVNVVILAHVVYDESTKRFVVPATGQFAKTGSWMSLVDEASYLFTDLGRRKIAHNKMGLPNRTTIEGMIEEELVEDYDVNKHIEQLENKALDNADFSL